MSIDHDQLWAAIEDRCHSLTTGAVLVTPHSDRQFRVLAVQPDRLEIRFDDSHERRQLSREQFGILADGVAERRLAVAKLPHGVEPYATVLTLLPAFTVDDEQLVYDPDRDADEESPYLVSPAAARTRPERLHDDAILLADLLDSLDPVDPETLDTETVTDLYVLLSDVQNEANRLRQTVRESLLARLGPDQPIRGRFGTVRQTTREYRSPKDDETVFDALDEHGIPREWVLGVDPDKLDVVLAVTDLDEDRVYDVTEQVYVQKTGVDEEEKYSRLQGLADRIERLDGVEGERLQEDLLDLEARLDEALSAG